MGDVVKTENIEIAIIGKNAENVVIDDSGYGESTADGIYLILDIVFKNISNQAQTLDNFSFKLKVNDTNYSATNIFGISEDVFHVSINPGIKKNGKLYFDVPQNVVAEENITLEINNSMFSTSGKAEISL